MAQRTKPALCSVATGTPGAGLAVRGAHSSPTPALRLACLHLANAPMASFSYHITLWNPSEMPSPWLFVGWPQQPPGHSRAQQPLQGLMAEERSTGQQVRLALCLFLTSFVTTQPRWFVCGRVYASVRIRGWDGVRVCRTAQQACCGPLEKSAQRRAEERG